MQKIGPRLWKTGLAVALTVFLVRLTGHPYEMFGAVAAALAVAPSASLSLRTAATQIGANLLGGLIGAMAILLLGPHPVTIGAVVVGVLWLCRQMKWQNVSAAAVTVTVFVMAPHADSLHAYVFWRLLSVVIGAVVGTLVNALVWPPDYWPAAAAAIHRAGARLDQFILSVSDRLARPDSYTKGEILAGAAAVDELIAEARRLTGMMPEGSRRAVADRSVKVLSSLLERIQIIHRAALTAQQSPIYGSQVPEVQATLAALVAYRQALYLALDGGKGRPAEMAAALLAIEQRFESAPGLPDGPEEVESFFRVYRMRSSVSFMANRLGRLIVAMDGARASEAPAGAAAISQ